MSKDMINKPPHYNVGNVECIDGIEAALGAKGFSGYLQGNAMKYLWRYQHKTEGYDKINDLKKCQWYLERLIKEHKSTYSQYEYSKDEMI